MKVCYAKNNFIFPCVGIYNLPKYDFFNQGRGYVLSDEDKKIIENIFTKVQI